MACTHLNDALQTDDILPGIPKVNRWSMCNRWCAPQPHWPPHPSGVRVAIGHFFEPGLPGWYWWNILLYPWSFTQLLFTVPVAHDWPRTEYNLSKALVFRFRSPYREPVHALLGLWLLLMNVPTQVIQSNHINAFLWHAHIARSDALQPDDDILPGISKVNRCGCGIAGAFQWFAIHWVAVCQLPVS